MVLSVWTSPAGGGGWIVLTRNDESCGGDRIDGKSGSGFSLGEFFNLCSLSQASNMI